MKRWARTIWLKVRTQFPGTHYYSDASGDEEFLKHPHRHMFHVIVKIQQFHTNRDIEYIHFKRWLDKQLDNIVLDYKSCEMLCDTICSLIVEYYLSNNPDKRHITIEVNEDGENGAIIDYPANQYYCNVCFTKFFGDLRICPKCGIELGGEKEEDYDEDC